MNLYLEFKYLSIEKKKTTIKNNKTASNEAVSTSCIEYQDLNIPLVKVFTPKYFTAPYSFKTSIIIRNNPEKIATLESGITILKKVLSLDIPRLLDKLI